MKNKSQRKSIVQNAKTKTKKKTNENIKESYADTKSKWTQSLHFQNRDAQRSYCMWRTFVMILFFLVLLLLMLNIVRSFGWKFDIFDNMNVLFCNISSYPECQLAFQFSCIDFCYTIQQTKLNRLKLNEQTV